MVSTAGTSSVRSSNRIFFTEPSINTPTAMSAFSPIYGATAIGRFAYSPMSKLPKTADKMVATVLGPGGIPAKLRIAGFTTRMYAMVTKVVTPPSISVRAVVPCSRSLKSRSNMTARIPCRSASGKRLPLGSGAFSADRPATT